MFSIPRQCDGPLCVSLTKVQKYITHSLTVTCTQGNQTESGQAHQRCRQKHKLAVHHAQSDGDIALVAS